MLAFGESLAFLSLLFPATVILLGVGALIGEGGLHFLPVFLAAAAGGFFGDWLSYYIGYYYKDNVRHMWPISRSPQTLVRGHQFFEKWGIWGVFFGRFFGPFRAVVPLVAGICAMPQRPFSAGEPVFCRDLGIRPAGPRRVRAEMDGRADGRIAPHFTGYMNFA